MDTNHTKRQSKQYSGQEEKEHEGLQGKGRVKCIQLYEYGIFSYAVCLPSTPLNIHRYFFMLKQKITFTEFSVLFLSSLKYSSSAKTFSVFPASQNCDPAKDSSHKTTTAEDKVLWALSSTAYEKRNLALMYNYFAVQCNS